MLQGGHGSLAALLAAHAGDVQAEGGVLPHGEVGHQGKGLEHHAHLAPPQGDEVAAVHLGNVLALNADSSGGGLDEPVEHTHEGGFARPGQPHDHEHLAPVNGEVGVPDADGHAGTLEDLRLVQALLNELEGDVGAGPEDLVEVLDLDQGITFGHGILSRP